jgi:hypothetical protein
MRKRFHSAFTMFVFLKGHHLVEYYFGVRDAHTAANDGGRPQSARVVPLPRAYPYQPLDPGHAER